eukprot:5299211-Amphidinium_carterae.1
MQRPLKKLVMGLLALQQRMHPATPTQIGEVFVNRWVQFGGKSFARNDHFANFQTRALLVRDALLHAPLNGLRKESLHLQC